MARPLARMPLLPAHLEPAGGDLHQVHAVEYTRGTRDFAARMSRLGTESAFEVLARARALERQGNCSLSS